jgi:hypothetical protein
MCESPAAFERDFCKRRWESAFFADSHGRGIFHQAIYHVVLPTNFTEDPNIITRLLFLTQKPKSA